MNMKKTENIKIFALGGVGEIGKNMYVVELDDDIYVVDAGLMSPENEMFGIDVVIPDVSYLLENKHRVRAIFLTHGHDENIGGLPFILRKLDAPVYGTKFTIALAKEKLSEVGVNKKQLLYVIDTDKTIRHERTNVTFFSTSHSIPGSIGIAFHTSEGAIVHTGDFKFDQTPVGNQRADIGKMAALGEEGVLFLLSDSTNAERPGYTASEASVANEMMKSFRQAKQRVIVATSLTHVYRIQQVIDAAVETNRKVVVLGRTLQRMVDVASDLDQLSVPEELFVSPQEMSKYSDSELIVLTAGTHQEPLLPFVRMLRQNDKFVGVKQTDTIIISVVPAPRNELPFSKIIDQLFRTGAKVIYGRQPVTVSGNGSQEELKFMLNLMKPTYFIPIQGEYRMQMAHAKLAAEVGLSKDRIFIVDKGDVIDYKKGTPSVSTKVPSGNTLIDGLGVGDVGNIVLRDRRLLSQDGILLVVVTIDKANRKIVTGPEIISRGFVYVRESEQLLREATERVEQLLIDSIRERTIEWSSLKLGMRESLNQFLYEKTKRRPMILPIIMEI
ncbi:ribonuclease J [Priestia koreensis]|uniref:ribonuclease J n=1 Tax=Priestia koreensis TaxID=284581 RepID=UPI001F5850C7|nr:ribonuclease J [Priestia koreensis]MCM3003716.1 ribonuclease J [Priestia koreensis]UNL83829.1 ribonuclease J [Priestia koreensis]